MKAVVYAVALASLITINVVHTGASRKSSPSEVRYQESAPLIKCPFCGEYFDGDKMHSCKRK